jgi:uncharacterized protein (DUF58 family)
MRAPPVPPRESALSARVVASIEDLELAARLVVEGLRAGRHRSPFHGYSAEFQQHRPYRIGDDLRYLDWKLLARTDRLYTRRFLETTSMSVMIVLDASASMGFPEDGAGPSKLRYATIVAASIAYLVSTQGDAVGLMCGSDDRLTYLPARGGPRHLRAVLSRLDGLSAAGSWPAARAVARGAELLRRPGVLLMISDLYDAPDAVRRELRRAMGAGHDVSSLQVMAAEERDFPFTGDLQVEDLETGERRLVEGAAAAAVHRQGLDRFLRETRDAAIRDGIDHATFFTDLAPEHALRRFLLARQAGATARRGPVPSAGGRRSP